MLHGNWRQTLALKLKQDPKWMDVSERVNLKALFFFNLLIMFTKRHEWLNFFLKNRQAKQSWGMLKAFCLSSALVLKNLVLKGAPRWEMPSAPMLHNIQCLCSRARCHFFIKDCRERKQRWHKGNEMGNDMNSVLLILELHADMLIIYSNWIKLLNH